MNADSFFKLRSIAPRNLKILMLSPSKKLALNQYHQPPVSRQGINSLAYSLSPLKWTGKVIFSRLQTTLYIMQRFQSLTGYENGTRSDAIAFWLDQHQNPKYVGNAIDLLGNVIDLLGDLVVVE
jgi:hypothetical protein